MKKCYTITCILFLVYFKIVSQTQEITSIYYDSYDFGTKQWSFNGYNKSVVFLDKSQRITEERKNYLNTGYNGNSTISIYQYDSKGRIIEKSVKGEEIPQSTITITRLTYNDIDSLAVEQNLIIEDSLKIEILQQEIRYEYDEKKRLIKKVRFTNPKILTKENSPLKIFDTYLYQYDEQNRIKTISFIFEDYTNEVNKTTFVYDLKGNLIEEISSRVLNSIIETFVQGTDYEYDNLNNMIKKFRYNFNALKQKEPVSKEIIDYDVNNRVIKKQGFYFFKSANDFNKTSEEYTIYNNDGQIISYTYFFYSSTINQNNTFRLDRIYEYVYLQEYYPNEKLKSAVYGQNIYEIDSLGRQSLYYNKRYRVRLTYETPKNINDDYFRQYIIYPNPTSQSIFIDNTLDNNCLEEVTLMDFTGHQLASFSKISISPEHLKCRWYLEIPTNIPAGMYLINMLANNGVRSGRQILIQR